MAKVIYGGLMGDMAVFSDDRRYRYHLRRHFGGSEEGVLFIMLNPSVADENKDDNTLRRCRDFAEQWGYGHMNIANLFAVISTDPAALYKVDDPVGAETDSYIRSLLADAGMVVTAWGSHGDRFPNRVKAVREMVAEYTVPYHLGLTKGGQPRHPLTLRRDAEPTPFPLG